jgi:tetratricopeptide (TPR) repeat protein
MAPVMGPHDRNESDLAWRHRFKQRAVVVAAIGVVALLIVAVIAVVLVGRLSRAHEALDRAHDSIAALTHRVEELESALRRETVTTLPTSPTGEVNTAALEQAEQAARRAAARRRAAAALQRVIPADVLATVDESAKAQIRRAMERLEAGLGDVAPDSQEAILLSAAAVALDDVADAQRYVTIASAGRGAGDSAAMATWLASVLFKLQQPAQARRVAEDAIARGQESASLYALLGRVHRAQGDDAAALVAMREAFRRAPQDRVITLTLAEWAADQGQYGLAEEALATLDANDPAVQKLQMGLSVQRGDFAGAIQRLTRMQAQDPDDGDVHYWLGRAYLGTGEMDAAEREFAWLAEHDPQRPDGPYWQGVARMRQLAAEEAIPLFDEAIRRGPSFAPAWEASGIALANEGRIADALERLRRAEELAPQRAEIVFAQAVCYGRINQPEAAITALQRALRLDSTLLERARNTRVFERLLRDADWEKLQNADG